MSFFGRRLFIGSLILGSFYLATGQKKKADNELHYVCFNSDDTYHNNDHCPSLLLCTGGKFRRIKNVDELKPCPKCVKSSEKIIHSGFRDIKRVLGVKNKAQIKDSLGTDKSTIHRPDGFSIRISGLPESKTVNMLEFYFDEPIRFIEDSILSENLYNRLGLMFTHCKSDTVRNTTPHPVTGKIKKDISIEYRGCAIVEERERYEDTRKYYYELNFLAKEADGKTYVDKIQLILRVDGE